MKYVNDYLNKLKSTNQSKTRSRTKIGVNKLLIGLFCLLLCFCVGFGANKIKVEDEHDFSFCELKDDLVPVNLNDICTRPRSRWEPSEIPDWISKYAKYGRINTTIVNRVNDTPLTKNVMQRRVITFDIRHESRRKNIYIERIIDLAT